MASELAIEILPASREDCVELAELMREADAVECMASSGCSPIEAVTWSAELSAEAYTVRLHGELAAMFGVIEAPRVSLLSDKVGYAWMLTTYAVERHARDFWAGCKLVLPVLLDDWDELQNAIDVRHTKAVRWAKRLGFRLEEPSPFGFEGRPFQHFRVRAGDLHV